MDIGNFLQNLFQPQTISSGVPSSGSYGSGQGMPPETDVLQRLLGGNPVNVMQQAGIDPNMPQPAPVTQQPQPAAQAPRPRRSLLETIGRISDVLATTGGATPLYEPTINAREDRARQIQADQQKLAAGAFEIGDKGNARAGMALRGLQAIQRGGGDVNKAWPILAAQAGVPPERAAEMAQIIAQDTNTIDGLAETFNGHEGKYAKQVNIAVDPATGKTIAYQVDDSGNVHQVALPEGYNPVDPITAINTGGATNIVGRNTGTIKKILPNTERPGAAADRSLRRYTVDVGSRDRRYVADTRGSGSGKGATPADVQAMATTAQGNIDELKKIYGDLDKMGAMVNPKKGTGANIVARGRASIAGQLLEGAAGTQAQTLRDRINSIRPGLMQSLAKATGMTGKQLDSNADVKLFMATVTDPTKSYQANLAAINGLERFLQTATKRNNSAPPRSQNSPKPARRASGPTVSNW